MTGPSQAFQIDDEVEIIGLPKMGSNSHIGESFKISQMWKETEIFYSNEKMPWYPASSLRKLTPEEVAMHTGTIGYQTQKCNEELQKAKESLWEILASLVDERLADIGKRQAAMEERQKHMGAWIDETNARMCQAVIRRRF